MNDEQRSQFTNRRRILSLLSDADLATISRAEAEGRLDEGDEYIDLGHLEHGVCRPRGTATPTRLVLARKAVAEAVWNNILAELETSREIAAAADSGEPAASD